MNKITKRSFYSFIALYLVSSFIFLALASYWFFTAQVSTEINSNYHKMNNIANKVAADVIYADLMKTDFTLEIFPAVKVSLYDKNKKILYGSSLQEIDFSNDYYKNDPTFTLISSSVARYLNVKYIVVQSNECTTYVNELKNTIILTILLVAIIIIVIAVILSYIFLKPLKDKMQEIESFIKDTTHELNTPISALMMSTARVKEKKVYDEKIITNISISTKQLYEIYSSLTFLNFDTSSEKAKFLMFDEVIEDSIVYFNELIQKKNLSLTFLRQECELFIPPTKAKMLINNLLSNAIKYSPPNKKISIEVTQDTFRITDEGIGIAKEKLGSIFERFKRASSYAGGFGIGLSIVKSITKEYGYKILISSEENKGTDVNITFRV
ncbi:MAG: two-component sensor histidine kinase [Sulfurimonas sp.]|nr:MAG: two-component sensor histidine kinase [Sulfurimonas sp.]